MKFDKTWIDKKEKGNNIVIFHEGILYRRKVKENQFLMVENELNQGIISNQFINIPVRYMNQVEYSDSDKYITVKYGKDSEYKLEINDQINRKEIFDYLVLHTDYKQHFTKKPHILSRIKKPLIAFIILVCLFAWIYYFINRFDQGYQYEIVGSEGSIIGFVFGMAQLGLIKNLFIFTIPVLISLYRIECNIKNNSQIHYILYKK